MYVCFFLDGNINWRVDKIMVGRISGNTAVFRPKADDFKIQVQIS